MASVRTGLPHSGAGGSVTVNDTKRMVCLLLSRSISRRDVFVEFFIGVAGGFHVDEPDSQRRVDLGQVGGCYWVRVDGCYTLDGVPLLLSTAGCCNLWTLASALQATQASFLIQLQPAAQITASRGLLCHFLVGANQALSSTAQGSNIDTDGAVRCLTQMSSITPERRRSETQSSVGPATRKLSHTAGIVLATQSACSCCHRYARL
jgi:hypothetical protein